MPKYLSFPAWPLVPGNPWRLIGGALILMWLLVMPAGAATSSDLKGSSYPLTFAVGGTHTVNWGDTISILGSVTNAGTAGTTNSFLIGFYLSTNTVIGDAGDYLLGTLSVTTNIAKGKFIYFPGFSIGLPPVNPIPGSFTNFYVGMVIDISNQVTELNKSNNANLGCGLDMDCVPLTITPPIAHILANSSTAPYTNFTVTFNNVADDGVGNAHDVQTVTIENTGHATMEVSGVSLTGSSDFTLTSIQDSLASTFVQPGDLSPASPRAVQPLGQEQWGFTLQFDPTAVGPETATLVIDSNDTNTPALSINLAGTGVAVPQIALTTPMALVNFGTQADDGAGGYQTTEQILVQNNGSGPLTISQNGVSLEYGTQFKINSITSSTQGAINLTAGTGTIAGVGSETWDISVTFDPLALGLFNDGLQIASNDPNHPAFFVPIQGQGLTPASLLISDSFGSLSNRTEVFPAVDADGPGLQQAITNIVLQNTGGMPLIIPTNGLSFSTGTQFFVSNIVSSVAGPINLSTNWAQIAPSNQESWTVTLAFDPGLTGTQSDTFSVYASNLVSQTIGLAGAVSVSGQGLARPSLVVSNPNLPTNSPSINFGSVLADGSGGATGSATLTLLNRGTQPLVITQNGLSFFGNPGFSVASVVSSTRGTVDLTSSSTSMRTIAPDEGEIWTVTLVFDPTTAGAATNTLTIASNDPQNPNLAVPLAGTGVAPNISLLSPASQLDVTANSAFNFVWQTSYPLTSASVAFFLTTTTNPASLIPIASGIPSSTGGGTYSWQASPSLAGTNYYVYATMTDGSVSNGCYAPGQLRVDPVGTFQLLSGIQTTNANYVYQYAFNGTIYNGTNQLALGANVILVTNGLDIYQFTVTRVSVLAQVDAVQYNQLNQVTTSTNGNGITTTLTYNPMGRVIRKQSSNGALVTYGYDVLGNRTNMTDYTGTTFYQWDDLNRLTAITHSKNNILGDSDDLTISYEYDLAGHKTAVVYPGGERIQYTYDGGGRLTSVDNVTRGLLFQYNYNPVNGQLVQLTRPNGIETDYSYDGMGRLTNILHQVSSSGTLVAQYGYTLDAVGKATLLTTTLPGGVTKLEQYSYDYFDRLTNVIYGDSGVINATALSVSYSYDGNDNRLTMTTKTNGAVTEIRYYAYGNENRLLNVTNQAGSLIASYAYDPAGNRIEKVAGGDTTYYTYDERNLMTSCSDATNQMVYAYDGDGECVTECMNGSLTRHVIDANGSLYNTAQEMNASGSVIAAYAYGLERLDAWSNGSVTFELTDRIGSVRLITSINGSVVQVNNYDAFGNIR